MQRECDSAIFNFQKGDEDLIDGLIAHLDTHAHEVYDFFEVFKPEAKVIINIIPTKKEYDDLYREAHSLPGDLAIPGSFIGNYQNGVITFLSLHDYKSTTNRYKDVPFDEAVEYYRKTILHEYVHFVNEIFNKEHACSYTERYLSEGIATYLSGQWENRSIPFDFSIEDILHRKDISYGAYYLVTKYFVENYDKCYVLEIFQSNRQARELLKDELYDRAKEYYSRLNKID